MNGFIYEATSVANMMMFDVQGIPKPVLKVDLLKRKDVKMGQCEDNLEENQREDEITMT